MALYRLYDVDAQGHVISPPLTAEYDDDRTAIAWAEVEGAGRDVEFWQEARRVIAVLSRKTASG